MLSRPVKPDSVMGLHPRHHVRDEQRVVLTAGRMEVEPPLGVMIGLPVACENAAIQFRPPGSVVRI